MEIYLWLNIIDVGSNLILQIWSLGFFLKRLEIWTFCGSSCEFQNSIRQVGYTIFGFRPTLASAFFPITIYLVNMVKIAKTYLFVPKSNPFF